MIVALCAFEAAFVALMAVLGIAGLAWLLRGRHTPPPPQCPECEFPVSESAVECPACGHALGRAGELVGV